MNSPDILDPFPPEIASAVQQVWTDHRDVVERFGLEHLPGGVMGSSWFVMVYSSKDAVDAYELARALETLQRDIEIRSAKDVTLMLTLSKDRYQRKSA